VQSLDLLGGALRDAGDLSAAESVLRQAQRRHPGDFWLNWNLAQCLEKLARREEAIRYYMIARSIRPESAHELAHALERRGELDEAIAVFQDLVRLKPRYGRHLLCLGITLQERGRTEEASIALDAAIVAMREYIRPKPDDSGTHYNLASCLFHQGKLDEAIAEFREVIRLTPDDAEAHKSLGRVLSDQGKLDAAIAEFREAIRLQPDYAEALNSLAWTLVLKTKRPRREYDEGVVRSRKAVELAPNDGNFANTLALAEYRLGHWAESMAASERAMALRDGGSAWDWFLLAMALCQRAEKDEARKWFDKAVAWTKEKEPKNAELRQFWTEASELLGQPAPKAPGTGSPAAPSTEKSR
jgi:tetratricopeptide (TPR) repeat protein